MLDGRDGTTPVWLDNDQELETRDGPQHVTPSQSPQVKASMLTGDVSVSDPYEVK